MRGAILALLASGSILAACPSPAAALEYTYCLQSEIDGTDCSFTSYDQCMASASGRGAECIVNPTVAFGRQNQQPQRQPRVRRGYNY